MMEKLFRKLHTGVSALSILVLSAVVAQACTCNIPPPVCSEYWETEDLFVGTVKRVYRPENAFEDAVEVNVDEAFKGMNFRTATTRNYGHSCAHRFAAGETYLFYAAHDKDKPNEFGTSLCSRTSRKGESRFTADLEFLRSVKDGKSLFWIWGTLAEIFGDAPRPGIRATVLNQKRKTEGISDEFGDIKLEVPGPGKYRVRVHLPLVGGTNYLGYSKRLEFQRNQVVAEKYTGKNRYVDYEVTVAANRCGWFDVAIPRPEKN